MTSNNGKGEGSMNVLSSTEVREVLRRGAIAESW